MEKIERLGQARLGVQPLSQVAGIAALSLPDTYYDSVRLTWKKRVETLYNALNDIPNIQHNRPSGAFYTMVQLPVDSSESFARYLVCQFRDQKQSLVVAPGGGFYQNPEKGQKQIRLAAVLEESKLKRAAEILREALIQYPGSTI